MKQKMTVPMFQEACRNLARQISEDKKRVVFIPDTSRRSSGCNAIAKRASLAWANPCRDCG